MSRIERGAPPLQMRNPDWSEILERGTFWSFYPEVMDWVPDRANFALSVQSLLNRRDPKFGGTLFSQESPSPEFISRIADRISVLEANRGVNLSEYDTLWSVSERPVSGYPGNSLPHSDVAINTTPRTGRAPQDTIRYTVGDISGTVFFPGLYRLDDRKLLARLGCMERPFTQNHILADEIERQGLLKRPVRTPALALVRFTGLDIHAAPLIRESQDLRCFLSLTFVPKDSPSLHLP